MIKHFVLFGMEMPQFDVVDFGSAVVRVRRTRKGEQLIYDADGSIQCRSFNLVYGIDNFTFSATLHDKCDCCNTQLISLEQSGNKVVLPTHMLLAISKSVITQGV